MPNVRPIGIGREVEQPGDVDPKVFSGASPEAYWGPGSVVYNPDDLVGRKGLATYRDMIRRNPAVKVASRFLESARLAKGWEILPGRSDRIGEDQLEEMAEFVRDCFHRIPGKIDKALLVPLMQARMMGFFVAEKCIAPIPDGPFKGKWYYNRFVDLWQENVEFEIDSTGTVTGFTNRATGKPQRFGDKEGSLSPLSKFIIHAHRKEKGNPYGTSELRDLYYPHASMDRLSRYYNVCLEKLAGGMLVGVVPDGSTHEKKQAKLDSLKRAHGSSVFVREASEGLEVLSANGVGDDFLKAILFYSNQILVGLGIPQTTFSGTGIEGGGGSYALAETQSGTIDLVVEEMGGEAESVLNDAVIPPLVRYCYGQDLSGEEIPRFAYNPHRDPDASSQGNILEIAKRIGLPIGLSSAYEALGLRKPGPEDVTIGRMPEEDDLVVGEETVPIAQFHIDSGIVTVNEILRQLGLPDLPDGDLLIRDWQAAHGITPAEPTQPLRFAEFNRPMRSLSVNEVLGRIGLPTLRAAEGLTVEDWREANGVRSGNPTRNQVEVFQALHKTEEKLNLAEIVDTLESGARLGQARLEDAALGAREGLRDLLKRRAPRLRRARIVDGRGEGDSGSGGRRDAKGS
jgi:hypothetical protein